MPQSDKGWAGVFADIALFRPAQATSVVMFRKDSDAAGQQCRFEARWILYDGWLSLADYIAVLIKAALQSTWLGVDLKNTLLSLREKLLYASKRTMFLFLTTAALRAIFALYNFKGKQLKYDARLEFHFGWYIYISLHNIQLTTIKNLKISKTLIIGFIVYTHNIINTITFYMLNIWHHIIVYCYNSI